MSGDRPEYPLLIERDGGIARLTLNRPDAGNAVNMELARALFDAAVELDLDPSVRCVVLTGAGRMFCAGGDIAGMAAAGDKAPAFLAELAGIVHMAVAKLARMSKPLLVLVNGPAAGAGLSLALLGDITLAARSSHYTAAYTAIGLTPDGGMTWLLPRLAGLRIAQEMILTNRRVGSEEAARLGLVTRLVDDEALAEEGAKVAASLAASATAALGVARNLLGDSFTSGLEAQMEREARGITAAGAGAESREGIAAFLGKRKPDFAGNS